MPSNINEGTHLNNTHLDLPADGSIYEIQIETRLDNATHSFIYMALDTAVHWTGINILNKNIFRPLLLRHFWVESKLLHWKCYVQVKCFISCCGLDEGSRVYSVTHHTSHVTPSHLLPESEPVPGAYTTHNTLCRLHLSVCIIYISEIFIEGLIVTLASCVHARACIIVTLVTADSDLMVCVLKACALWSESLCCEGRSSTCIVQCVILWDHFGENMMLAFLLFRGITLLKNFDSCNLLTKLHL